MATYVMAYCFAFTGLIVFRYKQEGTEMIRCMNLCKNFGDKKVLGGI
jgi:amino acid transporter